jgi:hypothetical protein
MASVDAPRIRDHGRSRYRPGPLYLLPVVVARGSGLTARGRGLTARGSGPTAACDGGLIIACDRGLVTDRDRGAIGADPSGMTTPHA